MRDIDPTVLAGLAAKTSRSFLLLKMTIDSMDYCITDCDIPLAWDGDLYQPRGFQPGAISYRLGKIVDSIQIKIDNLDDYFSTAFVGGTPQGSALTLRQITIPMYAAINSVGGPNGWWRLDDGSGSTAADDSGNDNDGTLEGTFSASDWIDGGLYFGGSDQRVDCGNSSPLNSIGDGDFSVVISMMAKDATPLYYGALFSKFQTSVNQIRIMSYDVLNQLRLSIGKSGNDVNDTFTDINPWDKARHTIVVVINRTDDKAYAFMDGVKSSVEISLSVLPADCSNTGNVAWGAYNDGQKPYEGYIFDAQVYPRALHDNEALEVSKNPGYTLDPGVAVLFGGEIDQWTLDEGTLTIKATNQWRQWNRKTLNTHSPSCRLKVFKGTRCGYSGSETECDRTYIRCQQLGNTDNFRGFRFLPSIEDKEIWWGRSPAGAS